MKTYSTEPTWVHNGVRHLHNNIDPQHADFDVLRWHLNVHIRVVQDQSLDKVGRMMEDGVSERDSKDGHVGQVVEHEVEPSLKPWVMAPTVVRV